MAKSGFTLIELAIVLVVLGLLLGGILKAQELITSKRVHDVIAQQDGIKAAYYGFLERDRAAPGDYAGATVNIPGVGTTECNGGNGNGNGVIETAGPGYEMVLAWEHLSKAGFLNRGYRCAPLETAESTPANPYSMMLRLAHDAAFAASGGRARHNLKTGNEISSDVLAAVDRKIDDGNPESGAFRFSTASINGTAPLAPDCYSGSGAAATWNAASPDPNCGGASLF